MIFISSSKEKNIIPPNYCAPFVPPNILHTPKSNLYIANSLAALVSEPDFYRLLTLHIPKHMFHFHYLGRTEASAQVRASCICFVTRPVFR